MNDNDKMVRAVNELTREICKFKEELRTMNYILRNSAVKKDEKEKENNEE